MVQHLDDGLAEEVVALPRQLLPQLRLEVVVLVPDAHLDAVRRVVAFAVKAETVWKIFGTYGTFETFAQCGTNTKHMDTNDVPKILPLPLKIHAAYFTLSAFTLSPLHLCEDVINGSPLILWIIDRDLETALFSHSVKAPQLIGNRYNPENPQK